MQKFMPESAGTSSQIDLKCFFLKLNSFCPWWFPWLSL